MKEDGEAAYRLAVDSATRSAQAPQLGSALEHLQRAAERGHRAAQTELAALVGNWKLVRDLAAGRAAFTAWERLRAAVDIAGWLAVPEGRVWSSEPRIAVAKRFIAPAACDWLIERARPHLQAARIYDRTSGESILDPGRTNRGAEFGSALMDMPLAFVRARIAALANVPVSGLETSTVLHYAVGEQYAPHHDFLDVNELGYARQVEQCGQRALTVLIYLNENYEGGETVFPQLGRGFKGRRGDALVFWNISPDGAPDWRTEHIGSAPTRGEKWLFSQWIRVRL